MYDVSESRIIYGNKEFDLDGESEDLFMYLFPTYAPMPFSVSISERAKTIATTKRTAILGVE